MFTFLEMLAMVASESSFGAYVCGWRPAGLHRHWRVLFRCFRPAIFFKGGHFLENPQLIIFGLLDAFFFQGIAYSLSWVLAFC